MNKRFFKLFSIISFIVTVASFLVCFLLYKYANDTKSVEQFSNTGFVGYTLFIIVFTAPLIGLLFAIFTEKGYLKPVLIIGNIIAFLSLSMIVASVTFYDFI